jgi:hypothetical protein
MMDTDRYDQQARRTFLAAAPHVDTDWFCQAVLARQAGLNKEAVRRKGAEVRRPRLGWKIAFAAAGTIVVAAGVIAAVPSSRAAAGEFFAHVFNWHTTTELHLGYLPDHKNWSETYGTILEPAMTDADIAAIKEGQKPGVRAEQHLYQNTDRFLQVRAVTDSGEALPSGSTVQINGRPGVLQTGLSGLLDVTEPNLAVEFLGSQPQDAAMMTTTTAGIDGTSLISTDVSRSTGDPSSAAHDQPIPYRDAIRLTWIVEDTRVEMLSNLPVAELVQVAEALILNAAPAPIDQIGTEWPKNASGSTYGSAADAKSPQDEPNLIRVTATNGLTGYAWKTDLDGPLPRTPEEALKQQSAQEGKDRVIPVYQSDGMTQIGVFAVSP